MWFCKLDQFWLKIFHALRKWPAKLLNDNPTNSHIYRSSFNVQLCAFQMHSREIIDLAKQKSAQGKFHRKIGEKLILLKAAVKYMINNSYNRKKCKTDPKLALSKTEKYRIEVEVLRLEILRNQISSRKLKKCCPLKAFSATIRRHINRIGLKNF